MYKCHREKCPTEKWQVDRKVAPGKSLSVENCHLPRKLPTRKIAPVKLPP